jgi:hypothetical protein
MTSAYQPVLLLERPARHIGMIPRWLTYHFAPCVSLYCRWRGSRLERRTELISRTVQKCTTEKELAKLLGRPCYRMAGNGYSLPFRADQSLVYEAMGHCIEVVYFEGHRTGQIITVRPSVFDLALAAQRVKTAI